MLSFLSIKSLYTLALAEGEGVGTAYEYFAKRLVLARWLRGRPRRLLVAGLPEKYGASLDFLQIGDELGMAVTVVDERPSALTKLEEALTRVREEGWLTAVQPELRLVEDLGALSGAYDVCLSSEVLQRLSPETRRRYVNRLWKMGTAVALFTPNADNAAHTNLSGLSGLHRGEMEGLLWRAQAAAQQPGARSPQVGYIDMPPFPPGITRTDEQREQATSGRMEGAAMWGLAYYARMENVFPAGLRRSRSHIVYGLV